jgi:hypothetical protein
MRFRGGALAIPMRCTAAFRACLQVTIRLSVFETLARGRVVGVSAAQPGHQTRARLIVIGSAKATVPSGANKDVLVRLNARGRALLQQWRSLPVRVEIADHSGILATRVIHIRR